MWIVVMGNIGVGKTTLSRMLQQHLGWTAKYESVDDNPYLEDFYKDMDRWAFESQIFFMNKKLHDILEIKKHPETVYIQDRAIFEDRMMFVPTLYEQGHLSQRDYDNYSGLYDSVNELIGKPDLIIYIKSSIENLVHQITKRGREMESNMSISYLKGLNDKYNEFAVNYDGNLLILEGDHLKFEQNKKDFEVALDLIKLAIERAEIKKKENL